MQPLPYYTKYVDAWVPSLLSLTQVNIFVVLIYVACFLLTLQMVLTLYNCWAFLYKQQKYKTLPLLLFYVLTMLLTIGRIAYDIMQFGYLFEQYVIPTMLPILKINMGLIQCWMLYELSLRVKQSML